MFFKYLGEQSVRSTWLLSIMKQWQIKCVQEKKVGHQKKTQTRRLKVFEIFPKVLCNFFFNLSLPLTPSPTKVLKSYNMAEFGKKKKQLIFFFLPFLVKSLKAVKTIFQLSPFYQKRFLSFRKTVLMLPACISSWSLCSLLLCFTTQTIKENLLSLLVKEYIMRFNTLLVTMQKHAL